MTAVEQELIGAELAEDLASCSLSLARAFHAGATLWVMSPRWEPHAHHVAVEFVHPVIVGKRALPSVALVGADPVAQARVASRPGDVLVAVAAADDHHVQSAMRRAPAWGVRTIWIGSGARPEPGSADHILWLDDDDPMVPATGRFVLMYHLLWELTHVCFEHPGLLTQDGPTCSADDIANGTCITCSDEGRLAEVVDGGDGGLEPAWVRTAEGEEAVDAMLVGALVPGDLILIHAGQALTRVAVDDG